MFLIMSVRVCCFMIDVVVCMIYMFVFEMFVGDMCLDVVICMVVLEFVQMVCDMGFVVGWLLFEMLVVLEVLCDCVVVGVLCSVQVGVGGLLSWKLRVGELVFGDLLCEYCVGCCVVFVEGCVIGMFLWFVSDGCWFLCFVDGLIEFDGKELIVCLCCL